MSKVHFVSEEDAPIIEKYFKGCGAVVLVMPSMQEAARQKGIEDGAYSDYEMDDADAWVDIVENETDPFLVSEE